MYSFSFIYIRFPNIYKLKFEKFDQQRMVTYQKNNKYKKTTRERNRFFLRCKKKHQVFISWHRWIFSPFFLCVNFKRYGGNF